MFKPLIERLLKLRIVRFGLTGGVATAIHLGIAFTSLRWGSDSVFLANLLGFSCAFSFSYLVQSLWVFEHHIALVSVLKFFIVQLGALLIAQLLSTLAMELNSYLRVVLVAFVLPMITFIIHKLWTFTQPVASDASPSK
jgi:putative flippase GtrA